MGFLGSLLSLVGFLALVVAGAGSYLYFTDYGVEAVVTDKGRESGQDYVVVTPKLIPYEVRKEIDSQSASFICEGYQVTYHIQSGAFQVYDREGRIVYDSGHGLQNETELVRCALLG